jgi:hypothetical protein
MFKTVVETMVVGEGLLYINVHRTLDPGNLSW